MKHVLFGLFSLLLATSLVASEESCLSKLKSEFETPNKMSKIGAQKSQGADYLLYFVEYPQNEVGVAEYIVVQVGPKSHCELLERDASLVGYRHHIKNGMETKLAKMPSGVLEELTLLQIEYEVGTKKSERTMYLRQIEKQIKAGDAFVDAEWLLEQLKKRWKI